MITIFKTISRNILQPFNIIDKNKIDAKWSAYSLIKLKILMENADKK